MLLKRIIVECLGSIYTFNPKQYWSKVMVTGNKSFTSREDSLNYLDWRNTQYYNYENLMSTSGHDNEVVLDYGCGPGNDVVGLVEYSKPTSITAADISSTAINIAKKRLDFHNQSNIKFITLNNEYDPIPIGDKYFDYIHTSGVLHHVTDINHTLKELHRILKDTGYINVMIYNRDSIFYHLYVAYIKKSKMINSNLTEDEIFTKSTDGSKCPISIAYKKEEFIKICNNNGFNCKFIGAAISIIEMSILNKRFDALQDENLPIEHRNFLKSLTFNENGFPMTNNNIAGIDAVYKLTKV